MPVQTYTGKAVELNPNDLVIIVSTKYDKFYLKYGKDYEFVEGSYKNNVNKGTASVTIRGKGAYAAGQKVITFKIDTKKFD